MTSVPDGTVVQRGADTWTVFALREVGENIEALTAFGWKPVSMVDTVTVFPADAWRLALRQSSDDGRWHRVLS